MRATVRFALILAGAGLFGIPFAAAADVQKPSRPVETAKATALAKLAVFSPMTGGRIALGRVEVEAHELPATVQFSSSNPTVANPDRSVTLNAGVTAIAFSVATFAVSTPTDVIITAQLGGSTLTTTLRVVPPKLAGVGCSQPANIVPGIPLQCKVWLDGPAPEDINFWFSANPNVVYSPDRLVVLKGQYNGPFKLYPKPSPQSVPVTITARYAGESKSTPVTLFPRALKNLYTDLSRLQGGRSMPGYVALTAPAPSEGLKVNLSVKLTDPSTSSGPLATLAPASVPAKVTVGAGATSAKFLVETVPVEHTYSVTLSASTDFVADSDVLTREFSVEPPPPSRLKQVFLHSDPYQNVPLGGKVVEASVALDHTSSQDALIDLRYSGETDIKGPAQVKIPRNDDGIFFDVTVFPCSIKPECIVTITAEYRNEQKTDTAKVIRPSP